MCVSGALFTYSCVTHSHVYLHSLQREDEGDLSSLTHLLLSVPRDPQKHHGRLWRYRLKTEDHFYHLYQIHLNEKSQIFLTVCLSFLSMHKHADMDIKPINKRASGQAFEVILKPSSPVSDVAHCITTPPKRDLSLEDIQKKLDAAEDRRRVRIFPAFLLHPDNVLLVPTKNVLPNPKRQIQPITC